MGVMWFSVVVRSEFFGMSMVLLMGGHAESVSEASTLGCARERSVAVWSGFDPFLVNTQAAAPGVDEVGGRGGGGGIWMSMHAFVLLSVFAFIIWPMIRFQELVCCCFLARLSCLLIVAKLSYSVSGLSLWLNYRTLCPVFVCVSLRRNPSWSYLHSVR